MNPKLNIATVIIALTGFSGIALDLEPTNILDLEPTKRGAYTFYTPYLEDEVEAMAIVAPPPSKGTEAYNADMRAALQEYAPSRVAQATQDARISPDYYSKVFGAVLGETISIESTPAIYALIARSISDYGLSTYDAKDHYQRTRPFAKFGLPTCTPYAEDYLRDDGGYPSGHTAAGYGISLVLAKVAPERADELIERGKDYGHSRVVCKVHYLSDIEAGIKVAEAVLSYQMDVEQFNVDLEAAQKEWKALGN
ncbi:MAG: phosphatase PAP2 family protein [Rhodobacteraceae bacterium]|nr:phosphatase PAP2 family protein [Paracoccaceae bacterium]